jgi:integrase
LKRAKRWHLFEDEFKPLPVRRDVGRALSPEEKDYLIKTSARRDDWQSARLAMKLALNTTMRGCELKGLRWRDVNLPARTITIRRSKTKAGIRVIPLNSDAWEAVQQLRKRSESIGGTHADHYVFFWL